MVGKPGFGKVLLWSQEQPQWVMPDVLKFVLAGSPTAQAVDSGLLSWTVTASFDDPRLPNRGRDPSGPGMSPRRPAWLSLLREKT